MAVIFQTIFCNAFLFVGERRLTHYDASSIEVCSSGGPIWQYVSMASGSGLAPNGQQAITWTNDHPFHRCIYGHNDLNAELISRIKICIWILYHPVLDAGWSDYINGSVQDCSISIALAMEILQSCTELLICSQLLPQRVGAIEIVSTFPSVHLPFPDMFIYAIILYMIFQIFQTLHPDSSG